jgi:hypothetical protein
MEGQGTAGNGPIHSTFQLSGGKYDKKRSAKASVTFCRPSQVEVWTSSEYGERAGRRGPEVARGSGRPVRAETKAFGDAAIMTRARTRW